PATRAEVRAAFAPRAQHAPPPARALATDILIATGLLSEGLNLQDATRVVHYDLPWSPARLAQRDGRVDRLGSPHTRVETVTFLPPPALEGALAVEQRLATKLVTQAAAGAAQLESVAGPEAARGRSGWIARASSRPYSALPRWSARGSRRSRTHAGARRTATASGGGSSPGCSARHAERPSAGTRASSLDWTRWCRGWRSG